MRTSSLFVTLCLVAAGATLAPVPGSVVPPARADGSVMQEFIYENPNAAPLQPLEIISIRRSPVPPTRLIDGLPAGNSLRPAPDGRYVNMHPTTDVNSLPYTPWDGRGLINPHNER